MKHPKIFDFYSDCAHGWLKVSLDFLDRLGLLDKISGYSYINKKYAFLEEDCDAVLFQDAYKKEYGEDIKKFRFHHSNNSKIRGYSIFDKDFALAMLKNC